MNYYDILEVSENSSYEVISGAYKALTKKYHPDVSVDTFANEKMKQINLAYEVLSDPAKRADYDKRIHINQNIKPKDSNNYYSSYSNSNNNTYDKDAQKAEQKQAEDRKKREQAKKREEEKARKETEEHLNYKRDAERKASKLRAEARNKRRRRILIRRSILVIFIFLLLIYHYCNLKSHNNVATFASPIPKTNNTTPKTTSPTSVLKNDTNTNSDHKSNLDYIAYDDNPTDSVFYFYKIEPIDDEKHYRYEISIDKDKNVIDVSVAYYYNEWHALDGGRITKIIICIDAPVEWDDEKTKGYSDLSKGKYGGQDYQISFLFTESQLIVNQIKGDNSLYLTGTYRGAIPK